MKDKPVKLPTSQFVQRWMYLLGLEEWEIDFKWNKLEDDTLGECSIEPHHKHAAITVDPMKHKTTEELLKTVRHEMIHVFHSEFNSYRIGVVKHLSPGVAEALDEVFSIAAEGFVLRMELLFKKLDIDVKGKYI